MTSKVIWKLISVCCLHIFTNTNLFSYSNRSYRVSLTSDGFVTHFPFPEHSMSFKRLSPGTQLLAFTTRVRRKATMDLATESFTKPKRKQDNKKCKASSSNTFSTRLEFCLGWIQSESQINTVTQRGKISHTASVHSDLRSLRCTSPSKHYGELPRTKKRSIRHVLIILFHSCPCLVRDTCLPGLNLCDSSSEIAPWSSPKEKMHVLLNASFICVSPG